MGNQRQVYQMQVCLSPQSSLCHLLVFLQNSLDMFLVQTCRYQKRKPACSNPKLSPPHPANKSIIFSIFFDMKKPSLRFRKGGVEEDVFNQGLAQPTSDNNPTVHARMSVNILLLVRLMCPM